MTDMLDGMERIRLLLAGARVSGERSYAMERKYYGDPSNAVTFESEKGRKRGMHREIDEVELLLDLWADDMRRWKSEAAGYPSEAAGGFIHSWKKDFEEAVEQADRQMIEKIDACVDSLRPSQRDAINRHYQLGANVWRFPKPVSFEDAKTVIRVLFVRKGLL